VKLNDLIADRLATWLSTMACFWIIVTMCLIPLFWDQPRDAMAWLLWSESILFQGAALPVLAFVARKEGNRQTTLLQVTHDIAVQERKMMMEELALIKKICGAEGITVNGEKENGCPPMPKKN